MGNPREPSRWLGERRGRSRFGTSRDSGRGAGTRRIGQSRMEAEANNYLLRMGWGGAGTARVDGMGRATLRRVAGARGGVHQFGYERTRLFWSGRIAHAGEIQ